MRSLQQFWRSLEMLSGPATLPAEWRRLMGAEYALMEAFFRPSGELATWFPHRDPNRLFYRVVTHGPDDHVGICDDTAERVVLATAELIIRELDRPAIHRALARALGLVRDEQPVAEVRHTDRIGHYVPFAGYRFPAFLTLQSHPVDFGRVVDRLVALEETPFLLLAPSRRFLRSLQEELLRRRRACFLPLDESVGLDDEGHWGATDGARRARDAFRQRAVPDAVADPSAAFFPTLATATWSDVHIRLLDGHTAFVAVGAARGVYNFAQMGMVNRKTGGPSVQWDLLRSFATNRGILTWRSPQADRRNQKRRELLARCLRSFFRIDGDPLTPHENGWRAVFAIAEAG